MSVKEELIWGLPALNVQALSNQVKAVAAADGVTVSAVGLRIRHEHAPLSIFSTAIV